VHQQYTRENAKLKIEKKKQPKKRKKKAHQTNPREPKPTRTKNSNPTLKEHTRNPPKHPQEPTPVAHKQPTNYRT